MIWAIAAAGGAGAVARFVVDSLVQQHWRPRLPLGTLLINVSGSFLLGLLAGCASAGGPQWMLPVFGVGFCGGYTTFSTASVELVTMAREGERRSAAVHAATMLVVSGGLAALGLACGLALGHAL